MILTQMIQARPSLVIVSALAPDSKANRVLATSGVSTMTAFYYLLLRVHTPKMSFEPTKTRVAVYEDYGDR